MGCVFNFDAKNEFTGEISGDKLWLELRNYFKSHSMAKTYYGIATNSEFLELASDRLSYNDQGLPTLESLLKVTKTDVNKEKLRSIVEKSLGDLPMDYSAAIYKIQAYNKENPSSLFLASFIENADKTVTIKVLDNTKRNKALLIDNIKKRCLVDRMMYYLRNAGVDVKFLEDGTQSRYSTANAEKNALGLYELIELSLSSNRTIRLDLTEHCGHLAIDILGNENPLVSRLLDALNTVLKSGKTLYEEFLELNPEFAKQRFNSDDVRAIAGWLVGQLLNHSVDLTPSAVKAVSRNSIVKFFGNLLNRIIDAAKVKLKKIPSKQYGAAIRQVNDIATQIAEGFTSPTFEGVAESMINNVESSYIKDTVNNLSKISPNIKVSKQILDDLEKYVKSVRAYDLSLFKQLQKDLAKVQSTIDFTTIVDTDIVVMEELTLLAIANALRMMIDNSVSIANRINKIDLNAEADFTSNIGKYANDIRVALMFAHTAENITHLIDTYTTNNSKIAKDLTLRTSKDTNSAIPPFSVDIAGKYGGVLTVSLVKLNNDLKTILNSRSSLSGTSGGLFVTTKALLRSYVKRFLSEIIGANQIERADRVLGFNGTAVSGETLTMDLIMDELASDLNWWERRFSSMSNNPDIWGQAFDKFIKIAKFNKNRNYLIDRNQLLLIQQEARKKGVNLTRLYERDKDGIPTCYLIGYVTVEGEKFGADWGRWQEDFDEFTKKLKLEFLEKYGAKELSKLREALRAVRWHKFYNDSYKKWHKENSITTVVKDDLGRPIKFINVPNPAKNKYGSDKYEKLSKEEKEVLEEYIKWKTRLDKYLPEGSTLTFRAPLIYASTVNQIHNRKLSGLGIPKAVGATLMQDLCDLVTRNANDTDYGSDNTINAPDVVTGKIAFEEDKIKRIPLFYINRLPKDKRLKLSTDLIGSSMAYSAMANQYAYLSSIQDAIEISHQQMKDRKLMWKLEDTRDLGTTAAYKRVTSYLERELYGLQFGHKLSGVGAAITKLIQLSTALASRMFLGGNIQGGTANAAMGFTEVLKEAVVGEHFNITDWRLALAEYFGRDKTDSQYDFITNNLLLDSFRQIKRNKVNQFSEYFDAFGDNDRVFRYNSYFLEASLSRVKRGNAKQVKELKNKLNDLDIALTTTLNEEDIKNIKAELSKIKSLIYELTEHYTIDSENLAAADLFWHNAFAPYSIGDHFMLLIPFIALAKHIKLHYNDNGKIVTKSMYDCYHIMHEGEAGEEHVNKAGVFGLDRNYTFVKNKNDVMLVDKLNAKLKDLGNLIFAIDEHISKLNDKSGFGFAVFNSAPYKELLDEYNIEIVNDADSRTNIDNLNKLKNELSKIKLQIHDLTWLREDENAFKLKAREIGNRLHGIYNQQDKVEFQQNILGNSILAMRGYMLGMVERRWGSNKYSLALGKDVEGSERTWLKTFAAVFSKEATIKQHLIMNWLPLVRPEYVKEVMEECGFSENQFYNMKRHLIDWLVIIGTSALVGGILSIFGYNGILGRPSGSDPDDYYPKNESDYAAALAYYFISRLYMEQAAYNEITSFTQVEGPSVLSLVGSNLAMLSTAYEIFSLMVRDEDYQKGEWKDKKKWKIKALKYTPYFRWHYSVGHDPRSAAEAFEINRGSFGRR